MSVGSDQHGRGSRDLAKDRELPHARVLGVDEPDSIRPRRDVETAGFTEVEEHGPGVVQQVNTRVGPSAVCRSTSGMRRPSSGCPSPRS
jgi:hypothetical protein